MLTSWLTFTAFLAASASPERAAITVAPTCRVKGRPEAELILNCGDGKTAGVVQYWHTPFGDLQHSDSHSELDPVFMHSDGSLVVPHTSILHSGLYYCLLQHTEGTTLWPYELHVGHNNQKNQEDGKYEQHRSSCGAFRFKRDVGSELERQEGVSDELFAGAVAASVLLTFVVGFSAGALSRTHVLRCLRAVTTRLPSPRKRRCQTAGRDSEVTMTDLPPMCDNQAFEADTSAHSATSSPPAKPQRSFRQKPQQQQQQEEQQETTAYLEGCDHMKEEERRREEVEEVAEGSLEEQIKVCDRVTEAEVEEERVFYLSEEDGGSQTETDEGECSEEREEKDRRESKEEEELRQEKDRRESKEEEELRQEKEVEEEWSEEGGEDRRESVEEAGGNKEEERDEKEEEEEEGGGDGETDSCSEDDETRSQKQEDTIKSGTTEEEEEEAASSAPRPARRSRIIRLYQYDDDGQRYSHLPEPAPTEPRPAPRLRQRSVSLTRLSAIMAAASAGPLDEREGGKEERTHFHMEI